MRVMVVSGSESLTGTVTVTVVMDVVVDRYISSIEKAVVK